jgi:ribonuclease VapC
MFLDASAIIAILAREPDAQNYADAIDAAKRSLIVSPIAVFEATTGLAHAKSHGRPTTPETIEAARVVVMAFLEANSVKEVVVGPRYRTARAGRRHAIRSPRRPLCRSQFRGLLYLCLRKRLSRAAAIQGRRFSATDVNDGVRN